MTLVAPPTTSRNFVAKTSSTSFLTPADTLFLRTPSEPSPRSSSYEKNCSVPCSLRFTNPESATRHETVLPSTNTMRTCAKTCSPSCKTSGSRPSNRQHFVDVDSPSVVQSTGPYSALVGLLTRHGILCGCRLLHWWRPRCSLHESRYSACSGLQMHRSGQTRGRSLSSG